MPLEGGGERSGIRDAAPEDAELDVAPRPPAGLDPVDDAGAGCGPGPHASQGQRQTTLRRTASQLRLPDVKLGRLVGPCGDRAGSLRPSPRAQVGIEREAATQRHPADRDVEPLLAPGTDVLLRPGRVRQPHLALPGQQRERRSTAVIHLLVRRGLEEPVPARHLRVGGWRRRPLDFRHRQRGGRREDEAVSGLSRPDTRCVRLGDRIDAAGGRRPVAPAQLQRRSGCKSLARARVEVQPPDGRILHAPARPPRCRSRTGHPGERGGGRETECRAPRRHSFLPGRIAAAGVNWWHS